MAVKVLELCRVSPPRGTAAPADLRLTFFDVVWLSLPSTVTHRLFLYHIAAHRSAFLRSHLPNLKLSLSLALKRFYPLAGRLVHDGESPLLRYSDDGYLLLTVAVSNDGMDPKDAAAVDALLPPLPISGEEKPVASVQVTFFPNQGIAVGFTSLDAAMDGSSAVHFMRTWASMCKSGSEDVKEDHPLYDRAVIHDPRGLREAFLPTETAASNGRRDDLHGQVHCTFLLTAARLESLRRWVGLPCSTFTLAVAATWTCVVKARGVPPKATESLVFMAGGRTRLRPPVAQSYFGNCVYGCVVEVDGEALVGEEGVAQAAAAIWDAIVEIDGDGLRKGRLEGMVGEFRRIGLVEPFWVVGSPKMRAYGVDFGWGRPRKVEVVSMHGGGGAMSLAENGGGEEAGGGLEVGLRLPPPVMDCFAAHFDFVVNSI